MTTAAAKPTRTAAKRPTKKRAAKARKSGKTPEQRQAEAKALHDTLTAQVEALTTSEQWTAFLRLAGSFPPLLV